VNLPSPVLSKPFHEARRKATGFFLPTPNTISLRCKLALAFFAFAFAFALSCSSRPEAGGPTAATPGNETREVTDEAGKRVRVPVRPQRIVTLAPNLTEIVYAVGAGDRLVGNTTFCDYPSEAKQVAKVGDTLQPNIERIIALRPELILISTASQLETFTKQLETRGIAVFVTDPHDLEGVFHSIKTVGDLLGQQQQAETLVNQLRARAQTVEEAVKSRPPVTVFYQVSPSPLWTAGRQSWITDLIRRAGGKSVTGEVEGEWMRYSDEAALASQPDAIIMATGGEKMEVAAALQTSPAVKNKRVYGINGDYLSRPGPRLVEGLEQIARELHPEAFRQ
jgi:iron complex transport system substrate-binding protein